MICTRPVLFSQKKEDEIRGTYEEKEIHTGSSWRYLKERNHLEDLGAGGSLGL